MWSRKRDDWYPARCKKKGKMMENNKNLYDMEHGSVVDTSLGSQVLQRFISQTNTDIVLEETKLTISRHTGRLEVINAIKATMTSARAVTATQNGNLFYITGNVDRYPVLCFVMFSTGESPRYREYKEDDDSDNKEGALRVSIDIYADPSISNPLNIKIRGLFKDVKVSQIRWWYLSEGRAAQHTIYLAKPETKLYPEFYPDIGDPYKFMDDYLNSSASVLLLAGPPGTGKTTLLRHMIAERDLLAHVIYDEELMRRDSIFQNFLFDKESDIMIIEDADTILLPREDDGNKIMARFLSVSDGLIKLPNKKLVFTTNISDFSRVDPALLRPGRCFATVHTRALNLTEAQAAAKVAGVPIPSQKGEYTLAELFNQGQRRTQTRRVGFIP